MASDVQLRSIAQLAERHDLPFDSRARDRMETYLELLQHFNSSMNLIGPLETSSIVDELLVDSLTPAALFPPEEGTVLDVGTGAGLPGIPLQCLYPERPLTLVEPRRKRATFLKIVRHRLDLEDVRIERSRIEDLPDERFDYVLSKAFRSPREWLEIATERVTQSGVIVCMTSQPDPEELRACADKLGLSTLDSIDDTAELGAPPLDPPRRLELLTPES